MGLSVKGQQVTLVYDCVERESLPLNRTETGAWIDTEGAAFISQHPLSDNVFVVGLVLGFILKIFCEWGNINISISVNLRGVLMSVQSPLSTRL